MVDGKYETREFQDRDDIFDVSDQIVEETKTAIEEGKEFNVINSIITQLPFFACKMVVYDKKVQKDIQRYIYCEKFNVQPYPGSYGEQPAKWIEKTFIIKNEIGNKEELVANKMIKEKDG